jgi:hypothetical protein
MAEMAPQPLEVALSLAASFSSRHVDYALGGAFAYGVWAIPRGTLDVDVNVFVPPERLPDVMDALVDEGAEVDRDTALKRAEAEGMFEAWVGPIRIDVFVPSIPYSWEAARRRRSVTIAGRSCDVLSPESLAVFKLLFFRPKDLVDLERLVAVQGDALDDADVRRAVVEMLGEDDPRVREWDRIVAAAHPR